jgi:hypothetical protein
MSTVQAIFCPIPVHRRLLHVYITNHAHRSTEHHQPGNRQQELITRKMPWMIFLLFHRPSATLSVLTSHTPSRSSLAAVLNISAIANEKASAVFGRSAGPSARSSRSLRYVSSRHPCQGACQRLPTPVGCLPRIVLIFEIRTLTG